MTDSARADTKGFLIYIKERVTVWTGDAFGFVGSYQVERAAAVRASHSDGRHSPGFAFCRLGIAESDLFKCDLLADEYPRRIHAVIDGRKGVVFSGKVGKSAFFVWRQLVWDLTVSRNRSCNTFSCTISGVWLGISVTN